MKIDSGDFIYQSNLLYLEDLNNQKDFILTFLHGGTITFINDAFCRFLGKTSDELIGNNFMSFILHEDKNMVKRHVISLSKKRSFETFKFRVIGLDAKTYWLRCTIIAHFSQKDGLIEIQFIGHAIARQMLPGEKS